LFFNGHKNVPVLIRIRPDPQIIGHLNPDPEEIFADAKHKSKEEVALTCFSFSLFLTTSAILASCRSCIHTHAQTTKSYAFLALKKMMFNKGTVCSILFVTGNGNFLTLFDHNSKQGCYLLTYLLQTNAMKKTTTS
jgi:hypothetical protein